jgi:hypothetical protein
MPEKTLAESPEQCGKSALFWIRPREPIFMTSQK